MTHWIPYLFNFALSSFLIFIIFALLAEGIIALFRIKSFRLIYWLRLLPFLKLALAIFDYSGSRWLHAVGQTVLEQPVGTRFLGVALGCDYLPFFKVTATAHNDLYFGIGDVLREFLPLTFPLFFLISLALVSFTLILFHLYQSLKSYRLLQHMLKSATLLQTKPTPLFESTSCGHSPLLIGIKRPLILLPRGLRNKLSDEELNAILKHERAHLLWKDHLAAPLIHIVCLTFWFVPLLRWYFRRVELAREMACDQSANHNPHALASALSKTTRHIRESHLIGALSFSSKKNCLKKRVESVLKYPRKPLPKWKKIAFSLASCFLAIFLLHSSIFPF